MEIQHRGTLLGIVGGSGFDQYAELVDKKELVLQTPFGNSSDITTGVLNNNPVVFMPRHGKQHLLAPHEINYRANIWALKELGVSHVLAINAVGGIHEELAPGVVSIPDQIIDYTYGRDQTFYSHDENNNVEKRRDIAKFLPLMLDHVDFTEPYDNAWREYVLRVAKTHSISMNKSTGTKPADALFHLMEAGVYGCTQGPRLETAAEIMRLKRDGCDMVGMTGMPEASLARELGLPYACIAISVNWAAGLSHERITFELIKNQLDSRMKSIKKIIEDLGANINNILV